MSGRLWIATTLVVAASLAGCGGSSSRELSGMVREPPPRVDVGSLPDVSHGGGPFRFRASDGGLLLVYFGYTMCPDVCPTTMSDIRLALEGLDPEERDRVDVALVTVDPMRDTSTILTRYVRSFVRDGHALRTEDNARLDRIAKAFGASYEVVQMPDGKIEVGHTALTYVVDERGRVVLQWPFGTRWEDIRDDLDSLLLSEQG